MYFCNRHGWSHQILYIVLNYFSPTYGNINNNLRRHSERKQESCRWYTNSEIVSLLTTFMSSESGLWQTLRLGFLLWDTQNSCILWDQRVHRTRIASWTIPYLAFKRIKPKWSSCIPYFSLKILSCQRSYYDFIILQRDGDSAKRAIMIIIYGISP